MKIRQSNPLFSASFSLSLLLSLCLPVGAQENLFTEVQPVYERNTGTWGHFPALVDMRSAWGDVDGDGDLDVMLMGSGPVGPVTKFFLNDPSNPAIPFAFGEVTFSPTLPQLQDGAMAWGDMDNDGDLDLAITGSVRAVPSGPEDLHFHVFRNNGRNPSGSWNFVESAVSPFFTHCRLGCLSWRDVDNDGDLDLFVSGLAWDSQTGAADKAFSRIYLSDGSNLALAGSVVFLTEGSAAVLDIGAPLPATGQHIQRVTWTDIDRDSFPDLILSGAVKLHEDDEAYAVYSQEVWLNWKRRDWGRGDPGMDLELSELKYRIETSVFARLGRPVEGTLIVSDTNDLISWVPPFSMLPAEVLGTSGSAGGAGDWNGDGRVDLFFPTYAEEVGSSSQAKVLLQNHSSPDIAIPGFSPFDEKRIAGGLRPLEAFFSSAHTSVDLFNTGKQQWLATVFARASFDSVGPPEFVVLSTEPVRGLSPVTAFRFGIHGRFRGVLDAVDIDSDGDLEVFLSGFDEAMTPGTRLYTHTLLANTAPAAPDGLSAVVTPRYVRFNWNEATDAQTRPQALRYAVQLRRGKDLWLIRPGAREDGRRLIPGLDGLLQTTEFIYEPQIGNQPALADGTYHWSVQAVDSGGMGSPFAVEHTFTVGSGPPPPDTGERRAAIPYRDTAIDLGDVDNDGDLDVVLAGQSENRSVEATAVYRNGGAHPTDGGSHVFSGTPAGLPALEAGAVRWGDVDGDGAVDLAIAGNSLGQPITQVYRNRGGVLELRNALEGVERSALDWGDFDNDGDLDLIVTGYSGGLPRTLLYRNGGTNNVSPDKLEAFVTTLPNMGGGAVAWGDYDHDGDLDLLLSGDTRDYTQPTMPCTAPPIHNRPPGASYLCLNAAQAPIAQTTLLRNDGLITVGIDAGKWGFTPVSIQLPSYFSYSGARAMIARAEWCDLNGDGALDFVLSGMSSAPGLPEFGLPSAKVFRNAGPGPNLGEWSFQPGQELLTGFFEDALQTFTCADWNGDGRPDLLLGGWLNGPGTVPLQLILNDNMTFLRRTNLQTTDGAGVAQFAGGLATFGHFDGDANVDVAFSGRWGIQSGLPGNNSGTAGRLFLNSPTAGNSRPTVPTNLVATVSGSGTEITLAWDRAFDNGIQPVLPSYNLHVARVDGGPGGMPGMADLATGARHVSRIGNVGHHTSWTLRDLPAGEYRWSVQAIDPALATSAFATAPQTFTTAPPLPPVITPLPPLHQWTVAHPTFTVANLTAIAAGRGARLVIGQRGQLFLSRHAGPFLPVESGVFTDLHDVLIDTEGATIVGEAGVIRTSSDGIVWTESPSGVTATLRAIARGGSGWVAAGDGQILHSTDRRSWTPGALPADLVVHDVAWAMGRYSAVGERAGEKVLLTSTDGLAWTSVIPTGLLRGRLTGVASDGQKFVAVGGSDRIGGGFVQHAEILSSTDGLTWTSTLLSSGTEALRKLVHFGGTWYGVNDVRVVRSSDLLLWEAASPGSATFLEFFSGLAVDNGRITAVGACGTLLDALMVSDEPLVSEGWTRRSGVSGVQRSYYRFSHLANNQDTVVAVGSAGLNFVSQDGGRTWLRGTDGSFEGFYGLIWGGGRFARSSRQDIQTSTDGVVWETSSTPDVRALAFGNGLFVGARTTGGFVVSTDGKLWSSTSAATPWCDAMTFGNGLFLAREAFSGRVHSSTDGKSWKEVSRVSGFGLFNFARDQFFARISPGFLQPERLHVSVDGVNWQPIAGFPAEAVPTQVLWHRDRYVALGERTLNSTDLITWSTIPIPGNPVAALSTKNGLLVAGDGHALLLAPDASTGLQPTDAPKLALRSNPAPGLLLLTITGRAGQSVTLEYSDSLSTWTELKTWTLAGGAEASEVQLSNTKSRAFLRLRWNP